MRYLPFEFEFILNLTYACNLRCQMCTQYGEKYKENAPRDLGFEVWHNFLKSIEDTNPKPKLILMGGEPLLYKDFDKLFLTAKDMGFKTHIITNGLLLDKHLSIFKDTETNITISIDGLNETHDSIRGLKGLFEKVVKNIEKISELQKTGSKINLRINHVLLPDNIDEIVEFHKFFNKFDIDTFTFQHLQFSTDELNKQSQIEWQKRLNQKYCDGLIPPKDYVLDENYVEKIKSNLDKFQKLAGGNNCFAFPALEKEELSDYYGNKNLDKLRQKRICTTPWTSVTVHSDGQVANCIGNDLGNIKDENFWDIWNCEKAQKLRDSLIEEGKFTVCTKCCNFYKGNFIASPDGRLVINGFKLELPGMINFVQSSKTVAFIKDDTREQTDEYIPVEPISVHDKKALNNIKEKYNVITIME